MIVNRLTIIAILGALLCNTGYGQSQNGRVLYQITKGVSGVEVQLKWFHNRVAQYREGCDIYYRTSTAADWTKINDRPLYPDMAIGDELLQQDSANAYYVELLRQEITAAQDPFILITLFSKSFQSNRYSQYLGNYHSFSLPITAGNIQFMVKYYRFGQELELAQTETIDLSLAVNRAKHFAATHEEKKDFIRFNWTPDDDAFFGVNVYRRDGGTGPFRKVNTHPVVPGFIQEDNGNVSLPDFLFEDTVSEKSHYEYRLEAMGYFENKVAESEVIKITTKDYTPPARAYELSRELKGLNTVHLSWKRPETEDFREIYVVRSATSEGPFERLHTKSLPRNTVSYTDEPAPGRGYYYYILTLDESGNDNRSNIVFTDIPDVSPPAPPRNVSIASDTGKIYLSWMANTEPDLRGYRIFRGVEDESYKNYILLNALPITETRFTDSLPQNASNKFLYYAVAVDSALNNSDPSKIVSAFLPDVTPPVAPFLYEVATHSGGIMLKWKASVDDDVAAYTIYRGEIVTNDSVEQRVGATEATKLEYIDQSAKERKPYYYFVIAADHSENRSIKSNRVTIFYQPLFPTEIPV